VTKEAGERPGCRVGVISDTHGRLFPGVIELFRGVDHIIHAGDIGSGDVLGGLRRIAPVTAVRGNIDSGPLAWELPVQTEIELCGVRVLVGHILADLLRLNRPGEEGYGVVVTGHSHKPVIEQDGSVLFLNPGSAGPRRFRLPRAAALLHIEDGRPRAEIVVLEQGTT
jgi:uncharacterized protein